MMKKIYTILALIMSIIALAQTPQGINYQATIRNATGSLIINQATIVRFNIKQGSLSSVPVYTEQHNTITDDLGAIRLVLGQGTIVTGAFNQINWASGNYNLEIEVDTGSGFTSLGTTQLLSVPYALYAEKSGVKFSIHINAFEYTRQVWNEAGEQSDEKALNIRYSITPDENDNYIQTGYVVGLNENVDINNSVYQYSTGGNDGVSFSNDFSFGESDGLQPNTTYYIKGWARKANNTYVYGSPKNITINP